MDTHYFLQPTHFCILKYELLKSFTIKEKCEGTSKHIYPNIRQVLYSPEKKKNLSKWILIIYIYIYSHRTGTNRSQNTQLLSYEVEENMG